MKRLNIIFVLTLWVNLLSASLLYDITDGKFRVKSFDIPLSMNNGDYYTLLDKGTNILKYNYKTGEINDTIFSINRLKTKPFKTISGYEFSPDETKLLVYTNVKRHFRRSFSADYYIYDIKRNELTALSDNGSQEVPLFSPNGRYIVFARDNNLFVKKLDFNTEIPVTNNGIAGKIINGTADWMYEEEFGQVRYFVWSPDSKMLAFVRFDESQVPEYSFQWYKKPSVPGADNSFRLYPELESFKYPKAGENISKVSLCVYDEYYNSIKTVPLPDSDEDFYIPRLKFTNSPDQLAVFRLNRNQNQLDMYFTQPKSLISKLILRQTDKHYVDYENIDYTRFLSDNEYFINVNEQDGFRHVYRYRMNGTVDALLTRGNWDITNVYGYDDKSNTLYYQSDEVSPTQRDVYSVDLKGRKMRLTDGKGTHNAYFNSTLSLFTDDASDVQKPNILTLRTAKGTLVREVDNNNELAARVDSLQLPHKEFFTFTTSENVKLYGWMVKPVGFQSTTKYPLLLVQYSGPDSQEVLNSWSFGWEYYLASRGIMVACVDGRGTGGRGSEFRKCTYEQLGLLETKDQVETARYFGNQSYVDKNRIGIWGWSYGGYMTLMAMTTGQKVFKAGIAVAPVSDWRLYDAAYTERYMRRPQENFRGYDKSSALLRAANLEGNLLIIHGTADDNVHTQNTYLFADKLVDAGKQFDMQMYTDKNHSILGKQTRRHLYTRMTDFLLNNL